MITNNIKKIIVGGLTCFGLAVGLSSCTDFLTIYPTDRIVGENFWKTKSDVDQMVDGCYQSMLSADVQTRAIIWGAYRSDELVKLSDYNNTTLDNISALNLLPTMDYCSWESYYKVINNCNIVLNHAPDVMELDPEFTQGDYEVVCAQMKALRSLCYFYLVRAFRDVPYVTHSVEDDTQVETLPQSTPAEVLQHCIDDLKEARQYIMKSGGYGQNDWRNWGYITTDAVDAILADIYLWRGSMTKNAYNDYEEVERLVEQIVDNKDAYYKKYHTDKVGTGDEDKYHLYLYGDALLEVFYPSYSNSRESILEWQYNGINNSNTALENHYYKLDKNASNGTMMASQIFNTIEATANKEQAKKVFFSKNDYRFWNNVYDADNAEAEQMAIRKMVFGESSAVTLVPPATSGLSKSTSRGYDNFRQNWVVYRITDLMLMEAEALVARSTDADEDNLTKAFNLVQKVNKRSMLKTAKDTLNAKDYVTKDAMELLVLAERERELCFEGKRWWDLLRYCYRGMDGVDINKTMASQTGENGQLKAPTLRKSMTEFITRKYKAGEGDAVSYKMDTEPYLYWPVYEKEMKVNNQLKQNPVWIQEKSTTKN
jgi:hypothetical protein